MSHIHNFGAAVSFLLTCGGCLGYLLLVCLHCVSNTKESCPIYISLASFSVSCWCVEKGRAASCLSVCIMSHTRKSHVPFISVEVYVSRRVYPIYMSCVWMYIYIYLCTYRFIYVQIHIQICMFMYTYTDVKIYIYTHVYIRIYIYVHTYIYIYVYIHVSIYIQYM